MLEIMNETGSPMPYADGSESYWDGSSFSFDSLLAARAAGNQVRSDVPCLRYELVNAAVCSPLWDLPGRAARREEFALRVAA